jgi:predicted transposase YbfD/YdcC
MPSYKSPSITHIEITNRKDGAKPLTLRQINYTLAKLHERQFFTRGRADKQQTFYSIKHNHKIPIV